MTKHILNHTQQKRKEMLACGAYDGRFRNRLIKDKRKQKQKDWARQKN